MNFDETSKTVMGHAPCLKPLVEGGPCDTESRCRLI